jgi:serine/threonine protein kinase
MRTFIPAGTEIAGYRVESLIGRGGMAMVYRAEHLRLGRRVALKVIAPDLAENEKFRQRFVRESRLAAAIDHPNILPVYEAGDADGMLFIAMRYVDGTDLKGLLAERGRLDTEQALSIFQQIAKALDVAHGRGLIHRDIKPGNILLTSDLEGDETHHVYLSDFGLTKRASSHSGLTDTGQFVGTIDYVAPEQITAKPVGPSTDIYALGCVLFESLTGTLPFDRDSDAAILWAHLNDPPPAVTSYNEVLPRTVDEVVATAMAKAPEDRFGTCRELVTALRVALRSGDPPAISGPTAVPEPEPPSLGPPDPALDDPALEDLALADPALAGREAVDAPVVDAASTDHAPAPVDAAPPSPSPRPTIRDRLLAGRRLVVLITVVALVVAGTAGVLLLGGRDESATFAATDEVPLSFTYPRQWRQRLHSGQFTVLSPHNLNNFFSDLEDPWAGVEPWLADDRETVVGVYLPFRTRTLDVDSPQNVETALRGMLSDVAGKRMLTFLSHRPVQVDGRPAARVSGRMENPSDQDVSLAFADYAIQVKPGVAAHLLLFGPDERALEAADFKRLVESVRLDAARVT